MKKLRDNLTKIDKTLLISTIIFFVFGLIMIQSASSNESYMRYGTSPYYYFFKQLIFLGVGGGAFLLIISIPTKAYRKLALFFMYIVIGMLGYVKMVGYVSNSAQSWINLGFFKLQPSEFAKIAIIIYLAIYLEKNHNKLSNEWTIIKPLIPVVTVIVLVVLQPDLGTACILVLMTFLILWSFPSKLIKNFMLRLGIVGVLMGGCVFALAGSSFLRDYQMSRFTFLDPCERYKEDTGYQLCNSFIAFNNGGLTGKGIGQSTQKYLYLPESYTDFIFPIIVEEWGLLVGIVVILMDVFILIKIYLIARKSITVRGAVLAYGVMIYTMLHVSINLIGVLGIGPLTGVPLPFLSYGGSYTLSLMVALALVQRVAIENKNILIN